MSIEVFAGKYAARFGFSSVDALGLEDFFQALELVAMKNKGFFLLKVDGERDRNIYTFALNMPAKDVVLRRDTDSIREGVLYIFSELERKNILP
jgi:hypothetical protein